MPGGSLPQASGLSTSGTAGEQSSCLRRPSDSGGRQLAVMQRLTGLSLFRPRRWLNGSANRASPMARGALSGECPALGAALESERQLRKHPAFLQAVCQSGLRRGQRCPGALDHLVVRAAELLVGGFCC